MRHAIARAWWAAHAGNMAVYGLNQCSFPLLIVDIMNEFASRRKI